METFGQEVKTKPSFSNNKINNLRYDLIKEELDELKIAIENGDLLEVADALTDILYVTYGEDMHLELILISVLKKCKAQI